MRYYTPHSECNIPILGIITKYWGPLKVLAQRKKIHDVKNSMIRELVDDIQGN